MNKASTYQMIDAAEFEKVIKDSFERPILISFTTPWMGSSEMFDIIMEGLVPKYNHKVHIYKCHVELSSELIHRFNIREFPTNLFIYKGELMDKFSGLLSKRKMDKYLSKKLASIDNN